MKLNAVLRGGMLNWPGLAWGPELWPVESSTVWLWLTKGFKSLEVNEGRCICPFWHVIVVLL